MVTTLRTSQSMELQSYLANLELGVTAAVSSAGSTQGDATALTETFNNITTVGASTQGVVLPTAAAGSDSYCCEYYYV